MLSLAQFIIAVYKVYHSVVTDFGEVIKLLDDTWSVPWPFMFSSYLTRP